MKECTLLFLLNEHEILLAMKKRGFGSGRWNGVGGKIEPGETIEQAMVRECQEEINVTPDSWQKVASLDFAFPDGTPDMRVHAFISTKWHGEPTETEEMAPKWFHQDAVPYDAMWSDDEYWVPQVLAGKFVTGQFIFDESEKLLRHTLQMVSPEELG